MVPMAAAICDRLFMMKATSMASDSTGHISREPIDHQEAAKVDDAAIPHIDVVAGAIWDGKPYATNSRLLIAQRMPNDMLGGLWELPGGKVEAGETFECALHRELREELSIEVKILEPLMTIKHTYTRFHMTLHVFHCRHIAGEPRAIECAYWTWALPDELENYTFPAADRKILAALKNMEAG